MDPVNVAAKLEVRSFTRSWDIWGTQKIWADPGYSHTPFSPGFLMGFCSHGPLNIPAKFEVHSFTRS